MHPHLTSAATLVTFVLASCAPAVHEASTASAKTSPRPVVVLMTDFGSKDDAPALLKGVVLSIARDAQVLDLTHEVPPFDIETGAQDLEDAPGIFPEGTVFVAVVDPGVGTARKAIVVELANGRFLVGPDNGVLSLAMARWGVKSVREIANPALQRPHESETFHGRDVFAPAGAHLAVGSQRAFAEAGPELREWVKLKALEEPAAVVAKIDDPYGNIWTSLRESAVFRSARGEQITFTFSNGKSVKAPLVKTFGDVKEGQPLAYWNSRGRLSLAINMGDAAKTYGVKRGDKVTISREK